MGALELLTLGAYLVGIAKGGGTLPINWTFRAAGRRWALRGWLEEVPPTDTLGPPLGPRPLPPIPPLDGGRGPLIPPPTAGAL